jgi:hypothetical protein
MGRHAVRLDATAAQTAPEAPSLPSLMKSPPHKGQPRKRTGGTGAPAYEVQAVAPAFAYGVPDCLGWLQGIRVGLLRTKNSP